METHISNILFMLYTLLKVDVSVNFCMLKQITELAYKTINNNSVNRTRLFKKKKGAFSLINRLKLHLRSKW